MPTPTPISALDDADEAARLRAELAARRRQTTACATEFREDVKLTFDWREQASRHPFACVGAALAVGYFLVPVHKQTVQLDDKQIERLVSTGKIKVKVNAAGRDSQGAISGFLLTAGGFALRAAVAQFLNSKLPWGPDDDATKTGDAHG